MGYLVIDLDKGTKEFVSLPARKMLNLPYIDALLWTLKASSRD